MADQQAGALTHSTRVGVLLVAHGSRRAGWTDAPSATLAAVQAAMPQCMCALAYLAFCSPTPVEAIAELVADGIDQLHVVPLFVARGGHVEDDIPQLIEQARADWPTLHVRLLPAIGELPEVQIAVARALEASF